MRKSHEMTIDRGRLLYILHLAEPYGLLNGVQLEKLCFMYELQLFGKGMKGLHFEFFRFAYGAFSKDLDNDLTSLRRKERIENFTVSDQTREDVVPMLMKGFEGAEENQKMSEIIQAVVTTYG